MRIKPALLLAALVTSGPLFGSPIPLGGSCKAVAKSAETTSVSFCNATPINMPAAGPASLYPSTINVNGVSGVISDLKVRLLDVTHANTSTIAIQLVPPSGHPIAISGSPSANFIQNTDPPTPMPTASLADWTFADSADDYALFVRNGLPQTASPSPTVTGSYRPRDFSQPLFDAPASTELPSQLLSSRIGSNPNGNWSLFVQQGLLSNAVNPQPTGTVAGGWCIDMQTTGSDSGCYQRTQLTGAIDNSDLQQTGRINRNGVVGLCTHPKTNNLFNSTALHYDAYAIVNAAAHRTCVTATADFSGCSGNSTQLVVYSSFNASLPGNNVISDQGYSSTVRLQNSFTLEAGASAAIVVHEIIASSGCPAYTILLEQNACDVAPFPSLFGDGFEVP